MDTPEICSRAQQFRRELDATKRDLAPSEFGWYPYGTLNNFAILDRLLSRSNRNLLEMIDGLPIADIGAADGDTAFFMESLGLDADVIDYPPTNFNGCRGVRLLKEARQSGIGIHEVDLDAHFELPRERYGLAFFLGILYHLKNPFGALENLSRRARYALISTRVMRYNTPPPKLFGRSSGPERVALHTVPVAYLVGPYETNGDPTNYWMFSEAGLLRILDRTGWEVLDHISVGNTSESDPATDAGDERAFCLVRSRH